MCAFRKWMLWFLQLAAQFSRLFSVLKSPIGKSLTCCPCSTSFRSFHHRHKCCCHIGGCEWVSRNQHSRGLAPQTRLWHRRRHPHPHPPSCSRDACSVKGIDLHGLHQRRQRLVCFHPAGWGPHYLPKGHPTFPAKCWERNRRHIQYSDLTEPGILFDSKPSVWDWCSKCSSGEVVRHQREGSEEHSGLHSSILGLGRAAELCDLL